MDDFTPDNEPDTQYDLADDVEVIDLSDLPSGSGGSRVNLETQASIDAVRKVIPHLENLPASKAVRASVAVKVAHKDEKNLKSKISRLVRVALETNNLNDEYAARTHYEVIEKDDRYLVDGFTIFVHRKIEA